jgi:quercetin dioxygenase-like cupin family protein
MKTIAMFAAVLIALANPAWAADPIERLAVSDMQAFRLGQLDWQAETSLPPGAQSALLVGNPSQDGVFVVMLKFPPNYPIPAHTHPFSEVITVLKGKLGNGMGKTFDKARGEVLQAGDSFALPAEHAHYVWTEDEETIVQLIATGPWGISYLDPADDPRHGSKR